MGRGDVAACFRHAERPAVERCEVCRRPVCGSCLWYAAGGERLCPDDAAVWRAAGREVISPERYAEGIAHSEASAAAPAPARAPYQGNSVDVGALLAAVIGVFGLASCFGIAYVIPLIAFVLGLVAWLQSRDAVDPARTRWLAGTGLVTGGVFLLGFFCLLTVCLASWVITLAVSGPQAGGFATPTP